MYIFDKTVPKEDIAKKNLKNIWHGEEWSGFKRKGLSSGHLLL
jgi:hypothetical protein